jgi:hypothetical protein
MQAGQTPPVSNVFHWCPQVQNHLSSFRGDQPQSGHRMRGPDGSRLFSFSTSRSKTTDDLATSFKRAESLLGENPILNLGKLHRSVAFLIVVPYMVDPRADLWITFHAARVYTGRRFSDQKGDS